MTEVENVNTEIKRATPPIPKTEMQMMLREQRRGGGSFKMEPQYSTAAFARNNDGNYSQFSQLPKSGDKEIRKSMQEKIG